MDEYIADQALAAYERIELSLVEFSKQIPLIAENEGIKSPYLASLVIEACGLLDSLFRDISPERITIKGKTRSRQDCDITHFAQLHCKTLDLANTRSILLISPPRYLRPFSSWEALALNDEYSPLCWWQAYNALKHDRLMNLDKATPGLAVNALCALHQLISRSIDLVPILMRRGWLSTGDYPVDDLLRRISQGRLVQEPIVQTKLFATPFGLRQFPEELSNLELHWFLCEPELLKFLAKIQ